MSIPDYNLDQAIYCNYYFLGRRGLTMHSFSGKMTEKKVDKMWCICLFACGDTYFFCFVTPYLLKKWGTMCHKWMSCTSLAINEIRIQTFCSRFLEINDESRYKYLNMFIKQITDLQNFFAELDYLIQWKQFTECRFCIRKEK